MSTYTQIIYHIVFGTKERRRVLLPEQREELFRYIWGILNNKHCHLFRINGVEDHLHILTNLHPTVALAELVKSIKISSTEWIKDNRVFPSFAGWQDGYGAFTHSVAEKARLIEYIKEQKEHHRKRSFAEEYRELLVEAGVEFDERFLL